jgi:hypothetical protein
VKVSGDSFFEGGDVIETNENIVEGGDCPFITQHDMAVSATSSMVLPLEPIF